MTELIGQHDKVVTPPIDFWGSRPPVDQVRLAARVAASETDPAWNELVTWFEQNKEWTDLVSQIENTGD